MNYVEKGSQAFLFCLPHYMRTKGQLMKLNGNTLFSRMAQLFYSTHDLPAELIARGIPGVKNTGRINKQANKHTDKPEANKQPPFPSLWKEGEGYNSSCFQLCEGCDLTEERRDCSFR